MEQVFEYGESSDNEYPSGFQEAGWQRDQAAARFEFEAKHDLFAGAVPREVEFVDADIVIVPDCGICMTHAVDFACAECRHGFCFPCRDGLLTASREVFPWAQQLAGYRPVTFACPMCRTPWEPPAQVVYNGDIPPPLEPAQYQVTAVLAIVDDTVAVLWATGEMTWEPLDVMMQDIPDIVMDYINDQ